jgi:hypothetical protein
MLYIDALVDLNCHLSLGLVVETADNLAESTAIQLFQNFKAICYVVTYNNLVEASLSIETVIVVLIGMTHTVTS